VEKVKPPVTVLKLVFNLCIGEVRDDPERLGNDQKHQQNGENKDQIK
jgi:hypothetical protein